MDELAVKLGVDPIELRLRNEPAIDEGENRPFSSRSSMADYLVPVNLDIGSIEALFVEKHDPHVNPLGVKGLGEIALVGMAPAIANAVFHATGRPADPHREAALIGCLEGAPAALDQQRNCLRSEKS